MMKLLLHKVAKISTYRNHSYKPDGSLFYVCSVTEYRDAEDNILGTSEVYSYDILPEVTEKDTHNLLNSWMVK